MASMDKDTFAAKVLDSEQTLYSVAKTMLINESDCEDAVSEAVLKAYMKLDSLKEEKYFKTWLVRILINQCYKLLRQRKNLVPLEYAQGEPQGEREDYTDLYRAVAGLSQNIRIVVLLHYIEGYSVEEVGRILKIPGGTVKSRLAKGRKLLKEMLKSE